MNEVLAYNNLITGYREKLDELRELLKLPEKLEKQRKSLKKKLDEFYLPFIIKKLEKDIEKQPTNEEAKALLMKVILEYKKIAPKNLTKAGKLKTNISNGSWFKKIDFKEIEKYREFVKHATFHQLHIEKAILFNLISYFETSLSDLARLVLRKYPNIVELDKKQLTYEELKQFTSPQDAAEYLISAEIERLLFQKLEDFIKFFESKVFKNIRFPSLDIYKEEVVEVKERRNLHVHNSGRVNSRYIDVVAQNLQNKYSVEKEKCLEIGCRYLRESIDKFELVGLEMLFMASLKYQEKSEDRDDAISYINNVVYNAFAGRDKNFELAKGLALFVLDSDCNKYLNELQKDYFRLNYWQILKRIDRTKFDKEVLIYDISSKNHVIKLCFNSLIENYEEACEHLYPCLNGEDFNLRSYESFAILEGLRKFPKAIELINGYKNQGLIPPSPPSFPS